MLKYGMENIITRIIDTIVECDSLNADSFKEDLEAGKVILPSPPWIEWHG